MSSDAAAPAFGAGLSPGRTFLFAAAGGAAVANLYWTQPLLDVIAHDLGSPSSTAGLLVTVTQIAYAVGILLVVPLGDVLNRQRLIPLMMVIATAGLVAASLAPSMSFLLGSVAIVGLTTVAGQLLTPLAGDLARPENRGRTIATVGSGLLIGILISRTLSGLVAAAFGWRVIFLVAAALDLVLAVVLLLSLPRLAPKAAIRYPALIASVFRVVARERVVRWSLVLGATGFAGFTMFWTALTFLLSSPPYGFSVGVIGLFGLAGLAGALAARNAGRLFDRGWGIPALGIAWGIVLLTWVLIGIGASAIAVVLVSIVILDIAIQAQNILVQTRILSVSHEERSRLNTAFVTSNFLGGAIGSALAGLLWGLSGWTAVSIAGATLAGFALTVWLIGRRGPLTGRAHGALSGIQQSDTPEG